MPPFPKFRGHRRHGSNPSSPKPSPTLNTPDSPFQHWEANSPPNDSSIPSYHWRIPSLSSEAPIKDPIDDKPPVLPKFSPDKTQFSSQFSFDHPRPASSSSVSTRATKLGSSFQPPRRLNGDNGEHSHPIPSEGTRSSADQKPLPRQPIAHLRERIPTDELEPVKIQNISKMNKTKLNLLNPMSLLARRRASQATTEQKLDDSDLQINSLALPAIPDDYDPRIRGKIVHDFSNPRPRRNIISPDSATFQRSQSPSTFNNRSKTELELPRLDKVPASDKPIERTVKSPEHAPMFREHFNDDRKTLRPESTGYLQSLAADFMKQPDHDPPPVPAFAKALPPKIPEHVSEKAQQRQVPISTDRQHKKAENLSRKVSASSSEQLAKPKSPPPEPPSSQANLPKHMKSTSSRFSFQLAGGGSSTEEKLLEENYKQKEASKRAQARESLAEDFEEDEFANYDFDDTGGFEERIPGVNVDADEDDAIEERIMESNADMSDDDSSDDLQRNTLEGFHFTPTAPTMISPTTTDATGRTSHPTPRDDQGQAIGFAYTKESPQSAFYASNHAMIGQKISAVEGLGISAPQQSSSPLAKALQDDIIDSRFDDDELYFDDGFIEDAPKEQPECIDETIFDDETGKIKNIPLQNAAKFEDAFGMQMSRAANAALNNRLDASSLAYGSDGSNIRRMAPDPQRALEPENSELIPNSEEPALPEGNLEAYHDALAFAANAAAEEGRFDRESESSQVSDDAEQDFRSEERDSHPGLVPDDSRLSHIADKLTGEDLADDDNFDESLLDDPMIAEANAEVLANDDEGFYGQEFGFYSRAHQKGNGELVNGGYFGPRGVEGIHRSHSAKANFQEPSLTPITERSEWSHRNSIASLQTFGVPQSAQSVPSPGLANLLEYGAFEDDMSLEALMKLRRGAWGGSQTSLHSSTSQNSSAVVTHFPAQPLTNNYFMDVGGQPTTAGRRLPGSTDSFESEDEDDDECPPSPTLTQNTPQRGPSASTQSPQKYAPVFSSLSKFSETSNTKKSHSRQSSGAESVSYVRDPDIADRWILERRRTGDDGETEVIGREILSGGI